MGESQTIAITLSDSRETVLGSFFLDVQNVPPSATLLSPSTGAIHPVGAGVMFHATYSDPGTADTHTAEWAFTSTTSGESTVFTGSVGENSVSDIFDFSEPGVYRVSLTVTDSDGDSTTVSTINGDPDLPAMVVIYDPTGGSVTGGGWIHSPTGSLHEDIDATAEGKATFGFVSKYRKGASIPTGSTEFQFHAGDLNFKSEAYEWLVVAGARAQFKGTGTINGQPGYSFKLTAIDSAINGGGDIDRFRIKIWISGDEEALIYDNRRDTGDENTTDLGGGNISIHKK